MSIGIVGAGMAGLYAAYWLKNFGPAINVTLYELGEEVGGRIRTHRFTEERNQYFEAGAMRIPKTRMHKPTFDLIGLLNRRGANLELIPYYLTRPTNRTFVNGILHNTNRDLTARILGFDLPNPYENRTAESLLLEAVGGFIDLLRRDFEEGWRVLMQYDRVSFRSFLLNDVQWPQSVVDFVETMCSQTNQFALSFPEIVMQCMDFDTAEWYTLADGMDRLPKALANVVGMENIVRKARVTKIGLENGGRVTIYADTPNGPVQKTFDKVILAIPPSAVRMIPERPRWSPPKEQAIRAMYFEPLYKIGLRFETRFWEHVQPASLGGQSTTDLPIRWIVYPSNGINSRGPGVLLLYSWATDASVWSSIPFSERLRSALCHLKKAFPDVNIDEQFIEAEDLAWLEQNPTGDAMFLPGQFTAYFDIARKKEGNIYFAGEHLSRHHTWITGALDSARATAQEVLADLLLMKLKPLSGWIPRNGGKPEENYLPADYRRQVLRDGLEEIRKDRKKFEDTILSGHLFDHA